MEPQSLICARVYAPGEQRPLDEHLFRERLDAALAGREAAFDQPFYRLVYGDSDTLPGVVIDRFGDILVVQLNNEGTGALSRAAARGAGRATATPRASCCGLTVAAGASRAWPRWREVVYGEVPQQVAAGGKRRALPGAGVRRPEDRLVLRPPHVAGAPGAPGCWQKRYWMSTAISAAGAYRPPRLAPAQVCCLDSSAAGAGGCRGQCPAQWRCRTASPPGAAPRRKLMADHARARAPASTW